MEPHAAPIEVHDVDNNKPIRVEDVKAELCQYLDTVNNSTGDFATIKKLTSIIDPKLRLLGDDSRIARDIAIPLGSKDALSIIDAAQQAPV